ncbi:PP0621 family protein [Roseateles sp.]|uniref:PP0621 family protein n=1 Tax=Roseateles sp. TaxID=1971397 RepID=UPI00286ABEA7|nr:PP0621 family protein [Roseateles sp.]
MKYLLLIALLALLFAMLARKRRRPPAAKPDLKVQPEVAPLSMVTCAQCGLHLPLDEALPGQGGVFCSAAHRASFELEHHPSS